jgi:hypothetical protein
MMVFNKKCEICNCICNVKHFQKNFKNWTSNNDEIDRFIQDTQLSAHKDIKGALEWIPYDKFYDIKYLTKNRYIANWIDGNIVFWNKKNENWEREGQNMPVNLRRLDSKKIAFNIYQ